MNRRSLTRIPAWTGAVGLLFAWTAHAQPAPEDVTPPPPPAGSATDEQPPAEALPPCPPSQQAVAPTPPPPPPSPPPTPVATGEKRHNIVFAPQEISVTTGAGPANYFGSALNSAVDVGAAWDARVTFGTHSVLALEAAYVGSSNSVDALNRQEHGRLDSHGVDGDLRLQLPTMVQPYVFGGVGYNHMAVTQTGAVSSAGPLSDSDNQVTVPAGAGLTGYLGKHATLDVRGTYRLIPDNNITMMSTGAMHQWMAQANFGYVF